MGQSNAQSYQHFGLLDRIATNVTPLEEDPRLCDVCDAYTQPTSAPEHHARPGTQDPRPAETHIQDTGEGAFYCSKKYPVPGNRKKRFLEHPSTFLRLRPELWSSLTPDDAHVFPDP